MGDLGVFHQIALVLFVTAVAGVVARLLSQPLIVAFVVTGILVGPYGAGVVTAAEELELLAKIGIALLLFVVGLKLDVHLIRAVGRVAVVAGSAQIGVTALLGFGLSLVLGLDPLPALYVGIALTFSSTIIIVKLLSDRGEIEQAHGRIALGILIVQDLVVVVVMIVLSAFGDAEAALAGELARVVITGVAFLAVLWAAARWLLPPLLHRLASTPELLVLFAIAWAVALAALSDTLRFSEEVGAFLGGVTIASTSYRDAIATRLTTLRDFLLLFFFIELGVGIDFDGAGENVVRAVVLSVFVLVAKPVLVLSIVGLLRYRKRVSFKTGVTLGQISEFSLIFAALGLDLGHIDETEVGLITMVALATIAASTYLILYSDRLFTATERVLHVFERKEPREGKFGQAADTARPRVVVIGLGRYGARLLERLRERDIAVLGVDYDPERIRVAGQHEIPAVYGDIRNPDLPSALPLDEVEWVISTVSAPDANVALLYALNASDYAGRVALTAHDPKEAEELREEGVRVFNPFSDAADRLVAELELHD